VTIADTTWAELASCRDMDAELFFDEQRFREAQRVCMECPVQQKCLAVAMSMPNAAGVWGGTSARKRTAMRRARRRAAARNLTVVQP
jgi:hypothetical protein